MKVLFNPVYPCTPHYETELELMLHHLKTGDEVHALLCNGELRSCLFNPHHRPSVCDLCSHIINTGITLIGGKNIIQHHYSTQPTSDADFYPLFNDIDDLKRFCVDGVALGLPVASTLISWEQGEYCIDMQKNSFLIASALTAARLVHSTASCLLADVIPDLTYLFNGRFFTVYPFVLACEAKKLQYKTHERAMEMNKFRLTDNALPHEVQKITKEVGELWSEIDKEQGFKRAKQFFANRRNGLNDSLDIDSGRIRGKKLPQGFNHKKKNIVICNSSRTEFAAIRGFDHPFGPYSTEKGALEAICRELSPRVDVHIYFRSHPLLKGNESSQIPDLIALEKKYANLQVIPPQDQVDTYALIDASDIVVVFHSTVGAEACAMGKPVIVLGHAAYRELGCAYTPENHEELISLLESDLKPFPGGVEKVLPYGLWLERWGTPYQYYRADGHYSGKFLGVRVCSDTRSRLRRVLVEAKDIRSFADMLAYVRKLLRAGIRLGFRSMTALRSSG